MSRDHETQARIGVDAAAYNRPMHLYGGIHAAAMAVNAIAGSTAHRRCAPQTLALALALLAMPGMRCWAEPGDSAEAAPRVATTTVVTPAGGATSLAGGGSHAVSGLTIPVVPMPLADEVIVRKSERRLYLMRHGQVLRSYRIALGLDPQGPKERAGDFRTPEGHYLLTRRNPRSDYFLSIQVSYPNDEDMRRAQREHADPGGSIMVHGLPNTLSHKPSYYAKSDWTDGCIALSDSDMVEVWLMTRDNTPIEIEP